MCRSLLADVQQRLIYRAHVYIKSQIHDYEPSTGDIAYPEKLEMIEVFSIHVFLFNFSLQQQYNNLIRTLNFTPMVSQGNIYLIPSK